MLYIRGKLSKGSRAGAVAQLGEHHTCTVGVAGSIPVSSTNPIRWIEMEIGCIAQLVEQEPFKLLVQGSSPCTSTNIGE